MKYIVLSFDDGRSDFYTNALPIILKYDLTATLNVITDYLAPVPANNFAENYKCITDTELKKCREYGIEIACHSSNHTNEIKEIKKGLLYLRETIGGNFGFASPGSYICNKNIHQYEQLIRNKDLLYIRSGNQVRRDGFIYALLYCLYKITKLPVIFNLYNIRNIIDMEKNVYKFYPSVTCNADNTMKQIISFIESLPDEKAAIIMFHSILPAKYTGVGYKRDKWSNSCEEFEKLCKYLYIKDNISVVTNQYLHNDISKRTMNLE